VMDVILTVLVLTITFVVCAPAYVRAVEYLAQEARR
jgi:hypothetical protein